jgi:imipenem/basic amino acid-specific outer membrane pore
MKKILLSTVVLGLISSVNAAEDLSSMFSEGKTSGQIREFSVSRSVTDTRPNKDEYTRSANAIGGYLKYETADYKGLSFGGAFYTTNGFLNDNNLTDYTKVDPSLLGPNNSNYSLLGEAYLQYKYSNTTFKGGRQKLDTPMAGSDDARMLPNLFEAYLLINTDIKDTTLIAGHVTKFAQGTFGRVYDASASPAFALLSVTSGYSAVDSRNQVGSFVNMGKYAIGKETAGVSVASATYTGVKNLKLQLWDYYAYNLLNLVYAQADYSWTCLLSDSVKPYVAAQFIKENDVGDKLAGNVNGTYWAGKFGAKVENFNASVAYSQTGANSSTDAATANAIISPWGGMPAFTQGMVTRHQFMAGTKAFKVAASYNFKSFGPDLSTALYYTSFDMDAYSGYGIARTATEPGFDIQYKPELVKNLNLRFRGNFPSKYYGDANGDLSWNEYRFIVNYNF